MIDPITIAMGKVSSGVISKSAVGLDTAVQMFLKKSRADYLFSREGLSSLIREGVNFQLLRNNEIPCFATCLRYPQLEVERFKLNDYDAEEVIKLLLASSAIPIVFPNEEFEGNTYCDGGVPVFGDNVPIQPVYDTGVEHIIVIHLSQDAIINKSRYPNSRIIEIVPSIDLGNALTGTLDFTADGAWKRMERGYWDTQKMLQPMVDMLVYNAENQKMMRTARKNSEAFDKQRSALIKKEMSIRREMDTDGFQEVFGELTKEM
jgi:NTE family protein